MRNLEIEDCLGHQEFERLYNIANLSKISYLKKFL